MATISIKRGDLGSLLIVSGILDTLHSKSLFDAMENEYNNHNCNIYLDVLDVKQISSVTIGFLVKFNTKLKKANKELFLYNVQAHIMKLFFHTNISKYITNMFEEIDTPKEFFN